MIALVCLPGLGAALGCAKAPASPAGDGGSVDRVADQADAEENPLAGTVSLPSAGAHDIQPFAFGQNYWNWEPTWGAATVGTQDLVKAAGIKLIRAGGANNELQTPDPFTDSRLDDLVAYVHAAGAEAVLQVPVINNSGGKPATAADAAAMVTYANVAKGYSIKFWSIGNEPDLYSMQALQPATYSAADYCATFRAYALAMKAADPSIRILGPELSWKYIAGNDWLTPFLDGCHDVVDIVSVHRYPFAPQAATAAAALGDAANFRQVVRTLRANLDRHGLTETPLAITEEHITYDGDPAHSNQPASPQTFYAALWAADVMGVALEENLWTGAFWHIADAPSGWKLAFIVGTTPQPTYHASALVATHFTGQMLVPSGVPSGFSAYAARDSGVGKTVVLVLNKRPGRARLVLAFDGSHSFELAFPAESMTLVTLADGAAAPALLRYTKELADAGRAPEAVPDTTP
jgi:hypothetical protein